MEYILVGVEKDGRSTDITKFVPQSFNCSIGETIIYDAFKYKITNIEYIILGIKTLIYVNRI